MSKYLFLFRGGDAQAIAKAPEEIQAHMQRWGVWMQGLAKAGTLVDGLPLNKEGKVVKDEGADIFDGPFTEGTEMVGGYLIVNATSLDEAVEISKGCPIYEDGGSTEVREIMSMNM